MKRKLMSLILAGIMIISGTTMVFAEENIETRSSKTKRVIEYKTSNMRGTIDTITLGPTSINVLKAGGTGLSAVVASGLGPVGVFAAVGGMSYICSSNINAAKITMTYNGKTRYVYEEHLLTGSRTLIQKAEVVTVKLYTGTSGTANKLVLTNSESLLTLR